MNALLLLQGLETLSLRMEYHVDNAMRVANHLKHHPKLAWVSYAGLPVHPHCLLAEKYMAARLTCGMVPWNDNGIFITGYATLDYLLYMWLSFTFIIVTISLAYMGKAVNRVPLVAAARSR